MDWGGIYRDTLTAFMDDLFSTRLDLFIPSPNQMNQQGANLESFVPNPDRASNPTCQNMFVFVGRIMGIALRHSNYLDFKFPDAVWKLLLDQPGTIADIASFDLRTAALLSELSLGLVAGGDASAAGNVAAMGEPPGTPIALRGAVGPNASSLVSPSPMVSSVHAANFASPPALDLGASGGGGGGGEHEAMELDSEATELQPGKPLTQPQFEAKYGAHSSEPLYFVTTGVLGDTIELCPGGQTRRVGWGDRQEYIQLVLKQRWAELQTATTAIRRGIQSLVPEDAVRTHAHVPRLLAVGCYLMGCATVLCSCDRCFSACVDLQIRLLTAKELELLVCGSPEIDTKLLREHTVYEGYEESEEVIQRFWRVFADLPNEIRSNLVRYASSARASWGVWGVWGCGSLLSPIDLMSRLFIWVLQIRMGTLAAAEGGRLDPALQDQQAVARMGEQAAVLARLFLPHRAGSIPHRRGDEAGTGGGSHAWHGRIPFRLNIMGMEGYVQ